MRRRFNDAKNVVAYVLLETVATGGMKKIFEKIMENVSRYGADAVKFGSHEQYTFPSYPNYLPDHFERIALTARLFKENGFRPVFFNEGLLGNRSWD